MGPGLLGRGIFLGCRFSRLILDDDAMMAIDMHIYNISKNSTRIHLLQLATSVTNMTQVGRARRVNRTLNRKGFSHDQQLVAVYFSFQGSLRPANSWMALRNCACFAGLALGYSKPLDWLLPFDMDTCELKPELLVKETDFLQPTELKTSESKKIKEAFLALEKAKGKSEECLHSFTPKNSRGGVITWWTFLKHIRLVRQIFALFAHHVTENKKDPISPKELFDSLELELSKFPSYRQLILFHSWKLKNLCGEGNIVQQAMTFRQRDKVRSQQEQLDGSMDPNHAVGSNVENTTNYGKNNDNAKPAPQKGMSSDSGDRSESSESIAHRLRKRPAKTTEETTEQKQNRCEEEVEALFGDGDTATSDDDDYNPPNSPKRKPKGVDGSASRKKPRKAEGSASPKKPKRNGVNTKANKQEAAAKKKASKEAAHATRDATALPKEVERPLFTESLKQAGAKLFEGETKQALLLEQLRKGKKGSHGKSWIVDVGKAIIQAYWIAMMSKCGCYGFLESDRTFHAEIAESEVPEIWKQADDHGITVHRLPRKGSDTSGNFLKIAHHGSEVFDNLYKDLRFDAPRVIRTMLEMKRKNDGALSINSGNSGDPKRGTIGFDFGYGHKNYDHDTPADCRDTIGYATQMIHWADNDHPEYKFLYESVGGVADMMQDFVDLHCASPEQPLYADEERTELFGAKLREVMGAKKSRFEAGSIGITILGKVPEGDSQFQKEYVLLRHIDGPNDHRKGYDGTYIFWCIIELDGIVYRLAVIFYSRRSIGDTMDKERRWLQPAFTELEEYDAKVLDYPQLRWDKLEPEEEFSLGNGAPITVRRCQATANPNGNYSGIVNVINGLRADYLQDNSSRAYRHLAELFYLGVISNSGPSTVYLLNRWRKQGPSSLQTDENGYPRISNFVSLMQAEFDKLGMNQGNVTYIRHQSSYNAIFDKSDEEINEVITDFIKAIDAANYHWDHATTMEKLTDITGIGPVKRISFYSIGVFLGLLHTDLAQRESFNASIAKQSAFGKYLEKKNCPEPKFPKALKSLSRMRKEPPYVTENGGCKSIKNSPNHGDKISTVWETYRLGQFIFDRRLYPEGNVAFSRRRINERIWADYQPPCIPNPELSGRYGKAGETN